jgi:hypothetical protein
MRDSGASRRAHQVTSVVIQDIPNGRSHWNYGFPFHSYVPVLRSEVNHDLWADLTRETQDVPTLVTLTLNGELRLVRAVELDYESSVFPEFAVLLRGIILESKFRDASFVEEGRSNCFQDIVRGRHWGEASPCRASQSMIQLIEP